VFVSGLSTKLSLQKDHLHVCHLSARQAPVQGQVPDAKSQVPWVLGTLYFLAISFAVLVRTLLGSTAILTRSDLVGVKAERHHARLRIWKREQR